MPRAIHVFRTPDRFVAGTVGQPGNRTFFLQAVHDGNMMIWYRSGTEPEIGRRLARVTLSGFLKAVAG